MTLFEPVGSQRYRSGTVGPVARGEVRPHRRVGPDPDWWRGAVIYQLYPRSFQDTSGDGVGDLVGITRRLGHVAALGVDAIWISPFFTSPMKDFGYDVSDYLGIDPMFGNLHNFDELVDEAHRLGMKVVIDLVLSHTSDQHRWFQESRADRDNERADWYVWAEPRPDGTPPNNWLSIFGGSAWTWDSRRLQYYMHNFLNSQPDLNFHNHQVQDALLDVARFWLDRDVDGFRLDTINFYFCDDQLRDNPPLPVDQRNDTVAPSVNPYNYQDHVYDKNRPENLSFLKRLREVLDGYEDRTTVGEVGDAHNGLQIMADYTAGDELVHMCYAFEFLAKAPITPKSVRDIVARFESIAPDGWACWAFSNHDVARHASRWRPKKGDPVAYMKMLAGLLMCLRGSVCLYQGEELGLTEADLAYEDLQDPYGLEFWPEFKGRDGCRTPMVWERAAPNCGFTTGQPWLPISPEHRELAVDAQEHQQHSMLEQYRRFLYFRQSHPALVKGTIEFLDSQAGSLAFIRRHHGESILCVFNFEAKHKTLAVPCDGPAETLQHHGFSGTIRDGRLDLPPFEAYFAHVANQTADNDKNRKNGGSDKHQPGESNGGT